MSDLDVPVTLDIPFAEDEFDDITSYNQFNFIYPSTHPISVGARMDIRIRLLAYSNEDYENLAHRKVDFSEVEPVGAKIYEIAYLREVAAQNVTRKEWDLSYGPNNLREYCVLAKAQPYDYVKVIAVVKPDYSLKELTRIHNNARKNK